MELVKKRLIDLNPAEYNPRIPLKPGMPAYEKLKRSIEEFGTVEPIIWNKRTDTVVGGHQRLQVLTDMAIDRGDVETAETDVVVVDLPRNKEKALNLALNKITGLWDEAMLGQMLSELKGPDLDLTGFEEFEIMEFTTDLDTTPAPNIDVAGLAANADHSCLKAYNVIISCMNEDDKAWLASVIQEDGRLKRQYTVEELKERLG